MFCLNANNIIKIDGLGWNKLNVPEQQIKRTRSQALCLGSKGRCTVVTHSSSSHSYLGVSKRVSASRSELLRSSPALCQWRNLHEHRAWWIPLRLSSGILWQDLPHRWDAFDSVIPANINARFLVEVLNTVLLLLLLFWLKPLRLYQPTTLASPILALTVGHATRFLMASSACALLSGRERPAS